MDWFTKHADAVMVIGAIFYSMIWMNTKFSDIDKRFSDIEKDIAIMKAVMVIQKIMPSELATKGEK